MSWRKALEDKIQTFPLRPGVYLMKDKQGKPLYVGKAKRLRHRVLSYFKSQKNLSLKNQFLLSKTRDVDCIVTQNEVEAFLLEASLIKKQQPKYNIRLKRRQGVSLYPLRSGRALSQAYF